MLLRRRLRGDDWNGEHDAEDNDGQKAVERLASMVNPRLESRSWQSEVRSQSQKFSRLMTNRRQQANGPA
jgi:hypothetical protein